LTYRESHRTDYLNPLPPSDAIRKQKKLFLEDLFSSVLSQLKKYHPSGNIKCNNLGIFQSLKFRILMEKNLPISLKLFTPNTFMGYGLKRHRYVRQKISLERFDPDFATNSDPNFCCLACDAPLWSLIGLIRLIPSEHPSSSIHVPSHCFSNCDSGMTF